MKQKDGNPIEIQKKKNHLNNKYIQIIKKIMCNKKKQGFN